MVRVVRIAALGVALACGPSVEVSDSASETSGGGNGTSSTATTTTATTAADTTSANEDTFAEGIIEDFASPSDVAQQCLVRLGARGAGFVWMGDQAWPGTISKIDHATLVEVARYLIGPGRSNAIGNISVGRNGDVVVSAWDSAAMIRADHDACLDPGNTSSAPDDVRPWPDGCVEWYIEYENANAIAWTGGELDREACRYVDTKAWITSNPNDVGTVRLVDGETGVLENAVEFAGLNPKSHGLWSAAVDSGDNLWAAEIDGVLVRVDRDTLEVETWMNPIWGNGVAVDRNDRVWSCNADIARFDYPTQTWESSPVGGHGGCTPGLDGTMWTGGGLVRAIDIDTLEEVDSILVGGAVGVAMDFDGYLWAATLGETLIRVEPTSGVIDVIDGFDMPKGDGDLTGTALAIVKGDL